MSNSNHSSGPDPLLILRTLFFALNSFMWLALIYTIHEMAKFIWIVVEGGILYKE